MPESRTVTISQKAYKELIDDQDFLQCLIDAGVDNWEGYDEAVDAYNSLGGDEEED